MVSFCCGLCEPPHKHDGQSVIPAEIEILKTRLLPFGKLVVSIVNGLLNAVQKFQSITRSLYLGIWWTV